MPAETPGQSGTGGLTLPAATRARLAWRPPALRAAQSLLMETPFSFSALQRAGRLLEWHKRLTHRFRPWLGWAQPRLEFDVELSADRSLMTPETALRPGWAAQQPEAALLAGVVPQGHRPEQRLALAYGAPPLAAQTHGAPERLPAQIQPIRLAHQTVNQDTTIPSGEIWLKSAQQGPPDLVLPKLVLLSTPQLPEPPEEPQPRVQLSVSTVPRREVAGGFPPNEPVLSGTIMAKPTWEEEPRRTVATGTVTPGWEAARPSIATSPWRAPAMAQPPWEEEPRRIAATETSTSGWEAARQFIATSAWPAPALAFSQVPESQTAIEKLIERTREPVPLPGLEIRVVQPSEREASDQRQRDDDREGSKTSAPSPAAAPQLDINAVADKVYQTLVRRQQFERERKGLY